MNASPHNTPESAPDPPSLPESIDASALPKIISFDTLARCGDEIWIENNGQIYRLRRTKQGKLILTK
jgi:hemin uptake protein HemP